jgi:hypothetical protein
VSWGLAGFDVSGITTEYGITQHDFPCKAGHTYRLKVTGLRWASSQAGAYPTLILRRVTTNLPELTRELARPASAGSVFVTDELEYILRDPGYTGTYSWVVSVAVNVGGSIHVQTTAPHIQMSVEDMGPRSLTEVALTYNTLSSTSSGVTRYDEEFVASWSECYKGDGTIMTNSGGNLYQGNDPSGFNGNQKSLAGWGTVVKDRLAGATVEAVHLWLYANHWYNNSGGTAVIGAHAITNEPSTFTGTIDPDRLRVSFGKPEGKWVDVTTWDWKGGSVLGVALGPGPTTSTEYYGRFEGKDAGGSNPPKLRLVYSK